MSIETFFGTPCGDSKIHSLVVDKAVGSAVATMVGEQIRRKGLPCIHMEYNIMDVEEVFAALKPLTLPSSGLTGGTIVFYASCSSDVKNTSDPLDIGRVLEYLRNRDVRLVVIWDCEPHSIGPFAFNGTLSHVEVSFEAVTYRNPIADCGIAIPLSVTEILQ